MDENEKMLLARKKASELLMSMGVELLKMDSILNKMVELLTELGDVCACDIVDERD